MTPRWNAYSSSVAEKFLIALTGLALFLYLVVHMAGNALVFFGPETFNGYAHMLITNPLVIPAEIGLAAIFLLHVYKTAVMWWRNRAARPGGYVRRRWAGGPSRKSLASTTMIYTGVITAVFVVLHVRAFKYGAYYQVEGEEVRDLYRLVVEFFQSPLNVLFYEACLVLLGFHLWHGFSSAFESLGADAPRYTPRVLLLGKVLAVLIAGGFIAVPLWVYFGGRA
ncbi:MAG: succinate dehydrogenase cytochrome b subunit [Acidobacteria bacterium]|nr:MAG: succinate dehydrogenase cytochrome b subunit [Acidobacteriota bacterium]